MGKFSDLKEKLKKATEFSDDDYYEDEYEEEYEQEDNYQEEELNFSSNSFGSNNTGFDFDFGSNSSSNSFGSSYAPKQAKHTISNEGGNIYRMNNSTGSAPAKPEYTKINRVLFFVLEDAEDARNIADSMIKKDCVILADMSKISPEDCNKVLNFLDGVRYICKSQIENINGLQLIVPDTIELTGDFYDQVSFGSFLG